MIAQRFSAGWAWLMKMSAPGTAHEKTTPTECSAVPGGLGSALPPLPTVETVGYLLSSRRAGLLPRGSPARFGLNPLEYTFEGFKMFRVRHGRGTSLASVMLRMILTVCFEGHTLCDSPLWSQRTNVAAI
jgi:hypothetical protein